MLRLILLLMVILMWSCSDLMEDVVEDPILGEEEVGTSTLNSQATLNRFLSDYELLPEEAVSISPDSSVWAQFASPTDKYNHGILGDKIEGQQLVVAANDQVLEFVLDEEYVFEDIRPRLYDVDGDGDFEIITIRSHVDLGGGIMIYDITDEAIVEFGHVEEIGTRHRWLNIVAIDDLDNDSVIELVWIQTPHIGGILKLAKITRGEITPISEKSQYSNHAIGETNLCLSALTNDENKIIYVPTQRRDAIVGFTVDNNELQEVERFDFAVDFAQPLVWQYSFDHLVEDETNCIY